MIFLGRACRRETADRNIVKEHAIDARSNGAGFFQPMAVQIDNQPEADNSSGKRSINLQTSMEEGVGRMVDRGSGGA